MRHGRERITKALDALTTGLFPFMEREMKAVYKEDWHDAALASFRDERGMSNLKGEVVRWDAHGLLTVIWDQWHRVFRHKLGQSERSLVSELREFRNRWAHQEHFNFDDSYRILDSAQRLLASVDAPEAKQLEREKNDLLRMKFSQEARAAYRKAQIKKRKAQDFTVYVICCASIVFVIVQTFGLQAWFIALFAIVVFAFLGYQRLIAPPPFFYGPHECSACGKIIYGETCPYCEVTHERATSTQPVVTGQAQASLVEAES